MKRALNIWILWLQPGVAPIDHARIVAEPHADFVETDARAGEQAGERVAHCVRRDPGQSLCLAVLFEWPDKIVAVPIFAVLHFRSKHERFAQSVAFQKSVKCACHRDGSFFPILELHRWRSAQMNQSGVKIEPERARFDNLAFAQSGVKSAVLNKFQIVAFDRFYQAVAFLFGAEISHRDSPIFILGLIQSVAWILPTNARDMNTPVEKRAQNRGVGVRGRCRVLFQMMVVKRLDARGGHVRSRNRLHVAGKRSQDEAATLGARSRELVLAPLVGEECSDLGLERDGRIEAWSDAHFTSSFNCLAEIGCFEADKMPDSATLKVQPINRAASVDAASFGMSHARLSRSPVTLGKKILWHIAAILRNPTGAGDETRTRDVLLGKKALCRGNCHALGVTLQAQEAA